MPLVPVLSQMHPDNFIPYIPMIHSNILPSTSRSSEWSLPFRSSNAFLISPMRATWPARLIHLDLITIILSGEAYRLWSSLSRCSPASHHFLPLWSKFYPELSWVTLQSILVSQSILAPSPCVTLKLDYYGVDVMGRLPWREDWSVFFTWPTGFSNARPSIEVFFTWRFLESPLLDPLLKSSSLDPLWILLCSTL